METFSLKTSYSIRPKTAGHLENPNWQGEWWCYWQRAAYWDYLGKYGLRLDVKNGTIKISYVDPIVTSFNSAVPTRIPRSDHTATKTFLWSKYSSWDIGLETIQKLYPLLAKFLLEWREIYSQIRMKRWHGTQLVLQEDVREVDYGRPMIHDRSLIEYCNLRKGQLEEELKRFLRDSSARLG